MEFSVPRAAQAEADTSTKKGCKVGGNDFVADGAVATQTSTAPGKTLTRVYQCEDGKWILVSETVNSTPKKADLPDPDDGAHVDDMIRPSVTIAPAQSEIEE